MKYVIVKWHHQSADDPILLYSEIDAERWEQRKVELFSKGPAAYSSAVATSSRSMELSLEPIPTLDEIASNPAFEPSEITKEEFEKIWADAVAHSA